ncbi:MAG TPA: DUF2279 domain-containing protein [Sedimentisphaerales bacterium]|nr:DUF2279 domain-containing protein [Sedimentisphaerales bacterium]HOH66742.1 DUF2279 domain-containing protein [Sedimentisphaerales bacterium]
MRYRLVLEIAIAVLLLVPGSQAMAAEPNPYDDMVPASSVSASENRCASTEKELTPSSSWWGMAEWPRQKKVVALNLAVTGALAIYGAASWDYGSNGFDTHDEGWFGQDTRYGGADKLGHAWSAYTLASVYNRIYRDWGYSDEDAIAIGVVSSWMQTTVIEIGDAFSKSQGFSWQDEAMNTLGVGVAYLRHRFPTIRETVDFRMEWFPSPALRHGDETDVFTDYSGQKYLLAVKPDGFLKTGDPLLKAIEFQVGYYTRGYSSGDEEYFSGQHRYGYIGIGLNVTYLLDRLTGHRAAGVFDYYQVPYTYISTREDFN